MTQRNIMYILAAIVLIGIIVFVYIYFVSPPRNGEKPSGNGNKVTTIETTGVITDVDETGNRISVDIQDDGEQEFAASSDTFITDQNGRRVEPTYLKKGFTVKVSSDSDNASYAKTIQVTKEPNIVVYSPKPQDEIGLPLVIEGEARVFENTFNYRLLNEDGTMLIENFATADSPDIGLYGPFKVETYYRQPKSDNGTLEVFAYSAKDESEIDKVTIPIKFQKNIDVMIVKVYFGSRTLNPETQDCNKVFPVERRIPKTEAVARAALGELLKGANALDEAAGYYTSINPGVKIQSLVIDKGTARVDFDETLQQGVGGSCRVANIRAQITQTLKQFPTVTNIVISIDGRTEDILQP